MIFVWKRNAYHSEVIRVTALIFFLISVPVGVGILVGYTGTH